MNLLRTTLAEFIGSLAATLVVHLGRRVYRIGQVFRRITRLAHRPSK